MSEVKKRMIAVYDKLIYFNVASKYTILRMRTDDPSVPEEARSQYTFRDRMLRFTAVGYGLPQLFAENSKNIYKNAINR